MLGLELLNWAQHNVCVINLSSRDREVRDVLYVSHRRFIVCCYPVAAGRGGRGGAFAPGGTFQGAAF